MTRELRNSLLIGLCCLLVYNANLRSISAGDTYSSRYLPFAILKFHTIFFEPIAKVAAQGQGDAAYWMLRRPSGHTMSLYPIVLPVLVTPLYLPAVGYLQLRGWSDARLDYVAKVMEKLTASFLAALSVSLLYLLLRRRAKPSIALLLTVAYAFGTTTWMVSSQALWQHGIAELMLIGALLLLTAPCTLPRAVAAGLLLGLIASNRPPDLILAAALGVYGLWFWAGRRWGSVLTVAAALPMGIVFLYNVGMAGNISGGYGVIGHARFFNHNLLLGLAGLLISPTRGLLVFSPFLLFLVLAWWHPQHDREERGLTVAMIVGVVLQIALYAKADWRSGLSWGPRYMTDLLPFLMWMLVPVVIALRGVARVLFMLAVGVAVAIEAIGASCYTWPIDQPIYARDRGEQHDMRAAFDWRNTPFLRAMKSGVAPPDLAVEMHGTFDAIESAGRATTSVVARQEVAATGWALAGHRTPWQVALALDGRAAGATRTFFDRPDVRGTLHENSPSGWRIAFNTAGLAPGVHHLTVMARAFETGEGYYLDGRDLTVTAPTSAGAEDLSDGLRKAAARLREHQQAEGYWLTSYTSETRFREPHPEMNTFLTALLVDLLDPLPATAGLHDSLQRARQHLTNQIESNGLVRYHGLPNGPGIGTLGCVITPDTDDTALVWRLAPSSDRRRLSAALATIDRYRTPEGLYRSWLAPPDAYRCLDPGSDPNPADVAIQMHLLLLLSEVRPPSGHALCEALRPVVGEDRLWVYYRKTPLIPILRLPDLRRAGCAVELPESRMRTDVPGQQIWVSVVRMLSGKMSPESAAPVLHELARDDFALIRTDPPLLYHNDLTATVFRYYWSEDVGYALWLRLYDEYERLGPLHPTG